MSDSVPNVKILKAGCLRCRAGQRILHAGELLSQADYIVCGAVGGTQGGKRRENEFLSCWGEGFRPEADGMCVKVGAKELTAVVGWREMATEEGGNEEGVDNSRRRDR